MTSTLTSLLLVASAVYANDPAWVGELSDAHPARGDSIAVTIPLGAHVSVGVYNTAAIDPQPPAGVDAVVRIIWSEHRPVFVGTEEERDAHTPFYLPMPKDCAPTGSWAVELEPRRVGAFVVPIRCDANTVTVDINCIDLPLSDIGYGFYTDMYRYADPRKEREYNRDMARHGMNTFVARCGPLPHVLGREIPGWLPPKNYDLWPTKMAEWAWHIDAAIDCGLVDKRFPVFALLGPDDRVEDEIGVRDDWPEFIGYSIDEPQLDDGPRVKKLADRWRAMGVRPGTSLESEPAKAFGHLLDVWCINAPSTTAEIIQLAKQTGKERWSYLCSLRGTNAPLYRYWTGIYTYTIDPVVSLTWTYMHTPKYRILPDGTWNMIGTYGVSVADADGLPLPTVALKGMADGIVDSRLLQELERRNTPEGNAYLATVRKKVDIGFWPEGKTRSYAREREGATWNVWDIPDTAIPPIDSVEMRREVCRLLGVGEGLVP